MLPMSWLNYLDLEQAQGGETGAALAATAAVRPQAVILSGTGGTSERIIGELVTGGYWALAGVTPHHGRFFGPETDAEPGAHPVVVLSHGLWQRRFGGDQSILEQSLTLDGENYTVIPEDLWGQVLRAMGSSYAVLANFPEDPSLN
jgi:hypothetical protein